MSAAQHPRMTSDEFLAWAEGQPKGGRYELEDGEVFVDMAPERVVHAQTKFEISYRLRQSIEAAGVPCMVMPDGVGIRFDDSSTVFEPDALVRCGPAIAGLVMTVSDPMVVVEVISPSSERRDTFVKLTRYFRLPSVQHYLIVDPVRRQAVHHQRGADGIIMTRIVADGTVRFDPPGVTLDRFWPEGLTE